MDATHSSSQNSKPSISPLRRDAVALAVLFALTIVMTNPLVLHLATAVEDKQDALLNTWIIAWVGHALITDPLNLFNANIFYPYLNTLAFSETMLPQALFALPFNLAFNDTVLGYNLVLLFSFFLAAYAMYLLVFDLTRHRSAAIMAGTIFAFNPYNLGNLAQVQLLSFGWLPLGMMYLRRLLRVPSAKPNLRGSFLFALFFSLQALSSFYYAFLSLIAVALWIVWFLITNRSQRLTIYFSRFGELAFSAILIALFIAPFFLSYVQVQRDLGFERKVEESEPFSANLKLYTEVSPQNVVYGNWLAPRQLIYNGGYPLDNLFPGFVALALAIFGLTASKNRDKWFYFLLLAFAFLLSFGPRLYLTPTQPTSLTLPYRWLYDLFPFMRALRAPVRFDALVMFALAVLAGFGATSRVWRLTGERFRTMLFACAFALCVLEYLAFPAANNTPVPVGDKIPEYVRWLAQQPPGVVLELPMIASDPSQPLDLTTQYLSTYHWHPTPDGYSGFNPPRRGEMAYEMQSFPNDRSVTLLQALNVEYVLIHADKFADWSAKSEALSHFTDLRLERQFGNDYVYRVLPRPMSPSSLDARLYLPQPGASAQDYAAFIIVWNHALYGFGVKPTDRLQINARWSDASSQQVSATLPLVTWNASVIPIRLRAPARTGEYRLDLTVTGTAIGMWNLSGTVNVAEGEPARQVVIPASVAAAEPLQPVYMPGEVVNVGVYWMPLAKIDAYYSASVRVVDSRGNKIVQHDREPAGRTFLWKPGIAVHDQFSLVLPRDLAPGDYTVQVLTYQADQGIDALLLNEQFSPSEVIQLGRFTVK